MKAINIGTRYDIFDDTLKTYDQLPAKTYSVYFNMQTGFHLEEHVNLGSSEKVYGIHDEKADKVLRSFKLFKRNLGVILSGNKGIGKSLFAKVLCAKAVQQGYPVIIVDKFIPGIATYIESIEQECVVLFDEFDKTFGNIKVEENAADPQAQLLTMFDGIASGKKLFVITCNDLRGLNDYLVNRPGRFHYHFRFNYPSDKEIREYLSDNIAEQYYGEIDKVIAFSKRVDLNYDCLRAIAFELNNGDSFEVAIQDLNILNMEQERYRVTLHFEDGTSLLHRSCYLDLFNSDEPAEVDLYDKSGCNVGYAYFDTEDAKYSPVLGGTVVDGEDVDFHVYGEDDEDTNSEYKGKKINHMTIVRAHGKNMRYYAV